MRRSVATISIVNCKRYAIKSGKGYLRYRMHDEFVPGAWSLGRHYKWIDLLSLAWVALITILFIFPLYKAGLPWESDFSWDLTNYTVLWFAGIGIVFGGWWFISAKNWFKGPVRQGTEEELERREAELAGGTSASQPEPAA